MNKTVILLPELEGAVITKERYSEILKDIRGHRKDLMLLDDCDYNTKEQRKMLQEKFKIKLPVGEVVYVRVIDNDNKARCFFVKSRNVNVLSEIEYYSNK